MNLLDEYNKQELDALMEKDEDKAYFLLELFSGSDCCFCVSGEFVDNCVAPVCYAGECAICSGCSFIGGFCGNCFCCSECNNAC